MTTTLLIRFLRVTRLVTLSSTLIFAVALRAQPTDNPIATAYGDEGYPLWTNEIAWDNVVTMTNQNDGELNFAAFETARDQLAAAGGGVLYYPAGTWLFTLPDMGYGAGIGPKSRGLMLKSGVVIRGVTPSRNTAIVRNPENFLEVTHDMYPETTFQFEFQMRGDVPFTTDPAGEVPRDWNFIGLAAPEEDGMTVADVHNVGVVNVELNGGTVFFGFHVPRAATLVDGFWLGRAFKDDWPAGAPTEDTWAMRVPDGTHYMEALNGGAENHVEVSAGSGRLVYGVRIINGAPWNDMMYLDGRGSGSTEAPTEGFSHYRFTGRISAHGSNIFIANNVLDKPTKNFVHQLPQRDASGEVLVLFDYANHIGIDVNKSNYGARQDHPSVTSPGSGYYFNNVQIRDNWVFNRANKGIEVSGTWVTIVNNHNERYFAGREFPYEYITNPQFYFGATTETGINAGGISFDGWRWQTGETQSDYMARGYDLGGRNLWISGNSLVNPGSVGNDGEGIFAQRLNRTEIYSWALTYNENGLIDFGPGTLGEESFIGGLGVHMYGILFLENRSTGYIGQSIGYTTTRSGDNFFGGTGNHVLDASSVRNQGVTYPLAAGGTARGDDVLMNLDSLEIFEESYDAIRYGNAGDEDTLGAMQLADAQRPTPAPTPTATIVEGEGVMVTYIDAADSEIGFRIDRRVDGGDWFTIAYRPRQSSLARYPIDFFAEGDLWLPVSLDPNAEGFGGSNYPGRTTDTHSDQPITELNPASWMDYNAPMDAQTLDYRVVALSADSDDGSANSTITLDNGGGNGGGNGDEPDQVYVRITPNAAGGSATSLTITFVPEAGKSYVILAVDDLTSTWSQEAGAVFNDNGDGTTSVEVPFSGDRRFFILGYDD